MPRQPDPSASPYDILGVSPRDDFASIRAAWRRLVRTWHPDVWYGDADAAMRRMQAVNDAYDTIARHHKRVQAELAEQDDTKAAFRQNRTRARDQRAAQTKPRVKRAWQPIQRPVRRHPAEGRFDRARHVLNGAPEVTVLGVA